MHHFQSKVKKKYFICTDFVFFSDCIRFTVFSFSCKISWVQPDCTHLINSPTLSTHIQSSDMVQIMPDSKH